MESQKTRDDLAGSAPKRNLSEERIAQAIDSGDFRGYQIGIMHDWLQTLTLLASILVPLFFVLDVVMMPAALLPRFALYRGISTVLALLQLLIVRRTKPSGWSYLHGYFISLQVGGIIAIMTADLGGFASSYYAGLNLVVIGVNLLMPWRARHTAANALLILGMYVSFNLLTGHPFATTSLTNNLFFLGATAVIAAAINHVRFRLIQKEFQLLVELKKARDELLVEKELVEDRTRSLKSLLDVSGQGFLSFDPSFRVSPEYSRECEDIFGERIENRPIDELLYSDSRAREDFRNGMGLYFSGQSKADVIFDLLDRRFLVGGRTVQAEYKAVSASRVMVVLTDITEELRLQEESRRENEKRGMLLKVVANRQAFSGFDRDAKELLSALVSGRGGFEAMVRDIHTLKGNAGFFGFRKTQEAAHELEEFLGDRITLGQEIRPAQKVAALADAFSEEVSTIATALGSGWLADADSIEVPRAEYLRIRDHVKANHPEDRELMEALAGFRRKPILELFARFPQMVADLAGRMGKRISPVSVTGGAIPVVVDDFEGLVASFVHLIRNMVDHGIELPGEREAKGKPAAGQVGIDIREQGEDIVFTFRDDGKGIRLSEIAERAKKIGLLRDGEETSPQELLALIFRDNFSTASTVSEVSGRGVGLAAVREAVRSMGGTITVKTGSDTGTVFTVTVPKSRVMAA